MKPYQRIGAVSIGEVPGECPYLWRRKFHMFSLLDVGGVKAELFCRYMPERFLYLYTLQIAGLFYISNASRYSSKDSALGPQ